MLVDPLQAVAAPRYFFRWRRSLLEHYDPIEAAEPEIPYCVADWLSSRLHPAMQAFEWGAGGSTVLWAKLGLGGMTVEHDRRIAGDVNRVLESIPNRDWALQVIEAEPYTRTRPADPSSPSDYASGVMEGFSFRTYVSIIDAFPDHTFDFVFVKGRSRSACLVHSLSKLKPGGCLILFDASTPRYERASSAADEGMRRRTLLGPAPREKRFATAYIWEKPMETRGAEEAVIELSSIHGRAT